MIEKNSKKAMSAVVSVVLLTGLVVVIVAVVWTVVSNLVEDQTSKAELCADLLEKLTINRAYTCYNSDVDTLNFSISVGDVNIDKALVSISGGGSSKSFEISNEAQTIDNVENYDGSLSILLPEKNSGKTYVYNLEGAGIPGEPGSIVVAPVINDEQCEISDSQGEIDDCSVFSG